MDFPSRILGMSLFLATITHGPHDGPVNEQPMQRSFQQGLTGSCINPSSSVSFWSILHATKQRLHQKRVLAKNPSSDIIKRGLRPACNLYYFSFSIRFFNLATSEAKHGLSSFSKSSSCHSVSLVI